MAQGAVLYLFLTVFSGTDAAVELWTLSGPVAKVVLGILLVFSVFSWSIIFAKASSFRLRRQRTRAFLRALYKSPRMSEVRAAAAGYRPSPAVEVFEAGYEEFERQTARGGRLNLAALERTLRTAIADQMGALETHMSWLATTASACPFIGLFGTVWGIIDSFHALGDGGVQTLRAVAPGISEALVTTAAGLFAAIPALIAYNQFLSQMRELGKLTEETALEVTNRAEEMAAGGVTTTR